jgi:hypothetical protein
MMMLIYKMLTARKSVKLGAHFEEQTYSRTNETLIGEWKFYGHDTAVGSNYGGNILGCESCSSDKSKRQKNKIEKPLRSYHIFFSISQVWIVCSSVFQDFLCFILGKPSQRFGQIWDIIPTVFGPYYLYQFLYISRKYRTSEKCESILFNPITRY